jgi:uncharacterized protein YndB with AHSA1/START domain
MTDSDGSIAASITIVRSIGAPVAEVFAAWTSPALMKLWLAPDSCQVVEVSTDPRPGGLHRIVVQTPDGTRHVVSGEYREVVPSERLVQTWVAEGENPPVDNYPTLLTVEFRATSPNSTELTLRQDQLLTVYDREGNREGWRQCLNKLDAQLSRQPSSAA